MAGPRLSRDLCTRRLGRMANAHTTEWIDAVFVRGGTSKGVFFTSGELPLRLPGRSDGSGENQVEADLARRDAVLCGALGSPDRFGRQLDGMGGGVSSLSKAMIVGRSERPGVDLDYTFAQVPVDSTVVDYSGNCGNLSSGVVPFALAAGLVEREDGPQRFTLFNINTGKTVDVRLEVVGGQAAVRGELELPGVAGHGAPIDLVYPAPGGTRTAGSLPTGQTAEHIVVDGREVQVSIVDAAIPLVFIRAEQLGLTGAEPPAEIDAEVEAAALIESVRRSAAVRAGLCATEADAPLAVPKVVLLGRPAEAQLLDGTTQPPAAADLLARTISMGRAHGAVPGTGAMCLAAAALIPGTVVADLLSEACIDSVGHAGSSPSLQQPLQSERSRPDEHARSGQLRIGTPSGVVTASAVIAAAAGEAAPAGPDVLETALARTARLLMRGQVAVDV